jgi:hypothetical protein
MRRQRQRARLAGFVHGEVGRKQHVAHAFGPGFVIELDQALEFAQDMGVAARHGRCSKTWALQKA